MLCCSTISDAKSELTVSWAKTNHNPIVMPHKLTISDCYHKVDHFWLLSQVELTVSWTITKLCCSFEEHHLGQFASCSRTPFTFFLVHHAHLISLSLTVWPQLESKLKQTRLKHPQIGMCKVCSRSLLPVRGPLLPLFWYTMPTWYHCL